MAVKVKLILPERKPWRRPRCSAEVQPATAHWRERFGKDTICELTASHEVNGKGLCRRHAGDLVLDLLIGKQRK